jgi:type III restriction enzyme
MFKPKNYQCETLKWLRMYLEEARLTNPDTAFNTIQQQNPCTERTPYRRLDGLADVPYVCLRLPTGGGKTYLATHSIAVASQSYLEQEYPLVLWMVPTNTIRAQTMLTLKKPNHPNRQLLEETFGDRLMVIDIIDFPQIRPQDLWEKVVIVITTMATPRIGSTDLRKIYAHHEALEPHFVNVPENTPNLERDENGKIKYSFRNLLALHRPLVIIDEAHNATSKLSIEVLQRVQPACVIEFTATPADSSNILHSVSALELKAEDMIKLPIMLTEHNTWQEAVTDAVLTRQKLNEVAKLDKDFIHPIVLFQAEEKGHEVTYDVIKQYLIDQLKIEPERIAIATGSQREIDGVNLLDQKNMVEFVITIEALKEGWDCPFAYVFCSVATVHSKKDVEQILGRVLRMPYAKERSQKELNRAYAHVSTSSWPQAASQLTDRLVSMGFEETVAENVIVPQPRLPSVGEGTGTVPTSEDVLAGVGTQTVRLILSGEPALLSLSEDERKNVTVRALGEGRIEMEVTGGVDHALEKKLVDAVPVKDRVALQRSIAISRQQQARSASQRGEPFFVPQLCLWVDGQLEVVEKEFFLDPGGLKLLNFAPELTADEFSIIEKAENYEIDINGRKVEYRYLGSQLPINFKDVDIGWTDLKLSRWLDEKLYHNDTRPEELLEFIRRTISYLINQRDIPLINLVRGRYLLEKALREKIKKYRQQAYDKGYQHALFDTGTRVETSPQYSFCYDKNPANYPAHWLYNGRFKFDKHYYPIVGELEDHGEEFECAKAIELNSNVKHWVRNLASQPDSSFRLPLSNGYCYPDFVAFLTDGRILVIEYKGAHLEEYEQEKKNIGELWEERGQGKVLFLWAVKEDSQGRDVYRQLDHKILP